MAGFRLQAWNFAQGIEFAGCLISHTLHFQCFLIYFRAQLTKLNRVKGRRMELKTSPSLSGYKPFTNGS